MTRNAAYTTVERWTCVLRHRCGARPRDTVVTFRKERTMLLTLLFVLVALWLLGVVTSYTMGGLIHILLVIAVVVVLLRVIQGRNPLAG